MDLGIGLPNAVPGTTGKQLTDWARAAEEAGFNTLGTIDRIVYPSYESLVALSAAAAVTERIRLATDVLLGPLRQNPSLIAKQMLSLDALAGGGRTVLGIGAGGREDDFEVGGLSMSGRGAWLDSALEKILAIWNGEGEVESKVGPGLRMIGPPCSSADTCRPPSSGRLASAMAGRRAARDPISSRRTRRTSRKHGRGTAGREALQDGPHLLLLGPDAEKNAQASLGYYAWARRAAR